MSIIEFMTNPDSLINQIRDKLNPIYDRASLVVIFGSLSNGDLKVTSDIDILVVSSDLQRDEIAQYLSYFTDNYGIGYDIVLQTPNEFSKNENRTLLREAIEGGKILWEKEKIV